MCSAPAEAMALDEISHLEQFNISSDANHAKVIAGHLVFCFMAGARWHDSMMYIRHIDMSEDRGLYLIEADIERHKLSRGKEQQTELVPFIALARCKI